MFYDNNEPQPTYHLARLEFFNNPDTAVANDRITSLNGHVYIFSSHGLFLYDKDKKQCSKVDTSNSLESEKRDELKQLLTTPKLSEGQSRKLTPNESKRLKAFTEIAFILRGFPADAKGPEAIYKLATKLLGMQNLAAVLNKIRTYSHEDFLMVFAKESSYSWCPEALAHYYRLKNDTEEKQPLQPIAFLRFKKFVNSLNGAACGYLDNAPTACTILSYFDADIKNKNLNEICEFFAKHCESIFNDTVSAEQWREQSTLMQQHEVAAGITEQDPQSNQVIDVEETRAPAIFRANACY